VLQPVSWVAAAMGVCVAAFYYVMNLRETTKNRRGTLTNVLIQPFTTKEFATTWIGFAKMKWDNFEDFQKKYDSRVNPENYAARVSFWNLCDSIGYQYRTGLIDIGTIYSVAGTWISGGWLLFGDVIKEFRKSDYPRDEYENFEYLAEVLMKMRAQRDADWKRKYEQTWSTH
jgi:hypothetical protein